MATYTVEPGRNIYRNGKPFISINREWFEVDPAEADAVTRLICRLLNEQEDRDLERAERKASGE